MTKISTKKRVLLESLAAQNLGTEGRTNARKARSNLYDKVEDIAIRQGTLFSLVRRSGWCQYSRQVGWFVDRLVLVGIDPESGNFAIRVPAKLTTVDEAIRWMTPAEVTKARVEMRTVIRQGDVYYVQQKRGDGNMRNLPRSHTATRTETGWTIHHPEHRIVELEGHAWKACPQRRLAAGGTD